MTFSEIDDLLGFPLPRSARVYQAWWANEEQGTHTHAKAWLRAGRLTSKLDLAGGKVVFVRNKRPRPQNSAKPSIYSAEPSAFADIVVPRESLTPAAIRLLADRSQSCDQDLSRAAAALINEIALQKRRSLVEEFARLWPRAPGDSAELIREERDGR